MFGLKTVSVLLISLMGLSACGHVHHETVNDKRADSERKVLDVPEREGVIAPVLAAPAFPPPNDRDLVVLTNRLAGGDVEIFDVHTAPTVPQRAVNAQEPVGMPSVRDPNVTVFPLANGGPYPGQLLQGSTQPTGWPHAILPSMYSAQPHLTSSGATKVYFNHGSSRLSPRDKATIRGAAKTAKFAPVNRIHIEGHASKRAETGDPVRNNILNLKESMNRAFEVSKEMMMQGVPGEKIKTTAWGDSQQSPSMPEDQARRVDVYPGN